jgi:hypothetical protein
MLGWPAKGAWCIIKISRNTDCRRRLISLRWPSSLVDSSLTCFTATLVPSNLHSSTLNVSPCPIFCICSISSYKHLLIFSFCTVRSTPSRLCMALASEPSLNARPSTVERRVREILVTQLKVLEVESPTSVIWGRIYQLRENMRLWEFTVKASMSAMGTWTRKGVL